MERDILFRELNALGLPSNGTMAFFEPRNFFMPEPNALELRRRYASILDTAAKSGNNYYLTDSIFYGLHPELGGRDLTSADSALIREWNRIKESHKRKNTADYLTDIVFYGLHPELGGRDLRRSETDLIQEWKDIKAQVVLNQTTGTKIEEREFKFELQTNNIIWRTDGRRRSKLPRSS